MTDEKVLAKPLLDAIRVAGLTVDQATALAGYPRRGVSLTRGEDLVTVWHADRISIRALNRHPAEIYGDYWLDKHILLEEEIRVRQEQSS